MVVSILGVPIELVCRISDDGIVATSPDWPVTEVKCRHPIAGLKELASAIEADMSRTLFERRQELLKRVA